MKRRIFRIAALGLVLLLCAGAAAESTEDISYTMAEKLIKQLYSGSGFTGTLTITAAAAQGRESDAFSTVKPIVLDLTYIKVLGSDAAPDETRLAFALNASEYQQGSAEFSVRSEGVYMKSSLLGDGWYLLSGDLLSSLLADVGLQEPQPAAEMLTQAGETAPASPSFLIDLLFDLTGGTTQRMAEALPDYLTAIDFWLEGYRESAHMDYLDDGTSVMAVEYRLPPDAVKALINQLLADLMNDEALTGDIAAMLPAQQAEKYLDPSMRHYYFYDVNELPLEGDLTIRRVMSLKGDTVELSLTMPFYDSASGASTLVYTYAQGGEGMPYENTFSVTGENSYLEVNYRAEETQAGATVYRGTVLARGAEGSGAAPQILWASFDLSIQSSTAKDLSGYENLTQSLKLSVVPAQTADTENAAQYIAFSKTDLTLDMRFSSLSPKESPTKVDMAMTVSGDDMAQTVTLALSGATTALWTPAAFDPAQAVSFAGMPADELQTLLSQAVVKGGLLILPYVNLPQIQPVAAD